MNLFAIYPTAYLTLTLIDTPLYISYFAALSSKKFICGRLVYARSFEVADSAYSLSSCVGIIGQPAVRALVYFCKYFISNIVVRSARGTASRNYYRAVVAMLQDTHSIVVPEGIHVSSPVRDVDQAEVCHFWPSARHSPQWPASY